MRRRGLRLILVLGFVAAAAGAGYVTWVLQTRAWAARAALAAGDAQAERATRALADLGAALEAYVAAGQQTAFWAPKVQAALDAYGAAAAELARLVPGGAADLVPPDDLSQLDQRARQLVEGDQSLVASDLLFTDGLEMIRGAVGRVDEARHAARTVAAATLTAADRQTLYTAAAALAVALLVIGLLAPAGAPTAADAAAAEPSDAHFNVAAPATAMAESDASLGAALDARLGALEPVGGAAGPAATDVDLTATADLCSDLGRLADASTLPALLGRAAGLLGAKGLTIWLADPTGRLYPGAAHGYSAQMLSRLGTLDPAGDNAAAAAYRTSSAQTVAGDAGQSGALVVPLMGVGGCLGVLAAEMEQGRERADGVRAVARIVAAQLATLVPGEQATGHGLQAADPPQRQSGTGL